MRTATRGLIVILLPAVFVLTWVRVLLTPAFVIWEYHKASFPPDPFGFSLQDRLHVAEISRQFLVNDAGIEFLGEQRLADGAPLYNSRELRHMTDVKTVVKGTLAIWVGGLVLVLLAAAVLGRRSTTDLLHAIQSGSLLTVMLLVGILAVVVLSWDTFFVGFHHLLFEGDTWLFAYSDSLIRLFPEVFWQDCFVTIGVGTGLTALVTWLGAQAIERRLAGRA